MDDFTVAFAGMPPARVTSGRQDRVATQHVAARTHRAAHAARKAERAARRAERAHVVAATDAVAW